MGQARGGSWCCRRGTVGHRGARSPDQFGGRTALYLGLDLSTVGHELPDEHLRLAVGARRMGPGGGSFETVLTYDYDRKICVPDYIPFD